MISLFLNIFLSLSLIIIGVKYFLKWIFLRKKYIPNIAHVISTESKLDADLLVKYSIIQYKVDGEIIIKKINYGMSILGWKVGDKIKIFYNPKNPSIYFLNDFKIKFLSGLLIIAGLFFLFLSFI